MDKFIYSTSEAVCNGLNSIGLNQLAYDIGFQGADILGRPTVFCGAQTGGSYWFGVILWGIALYVVFAAVGGRRQRAGTDE
jgi:hypothetical protein